MPAELFPAIVIGGGLVVWVSLRSGSHRKLVCLSYAVIIGSLLGAQTLAEVTGLASGKTEPSGPGWSLIIALLILYILSVIGTGIGGILLLRDMYHSPPKKQYRVGTKRR